MKFATVLACFAAAFTAVCAPESLNANLFINGDFSEGLKHWKFENKNIAVDPDQKLNGKTVVKLPGKSEIRQNFVIKPDTDYILTYQVSGKAIKSANPRNQGARFMLNANKRWQRATPVAGGACMTGTFDWQKGEYRFNSTKDFSGGGKLTIKLVLDSEGMLYVADVKLVEVAK